MKRKVISLLIAVILLSACVVVLPLVNADIAPLAPVEFFQDFEGESITVGDGYTAEEIQEMTGVPIKFIKNTALSPVSVSVIEEEDGNKALRLITAENSDQIYPEYVLETPLLAGKLESSFELALEQGTGSWSMFEIYNTSRVEKTTIRFQNRWFDVATDKAIVTPQMNEKGKYCLRIVISRADVAEPWKIEIYDDARQTPVLCYEGKMPADYGAIASFKSFRVFATNTGWPGILDNYKVATTYFPTVLPQKDGLNGADPHDAEFLIGFDSAIPNPDDKVTIVNVEEPTVVIDAETEYNTTNGEMLIKPASFLAYDTDYKLVFENGGVMSHSFITKSAPLSITEETLTYTPDGGVPSDTMPQNGTFTVSGTVKITNATDTIKYAKVMVIAYDEDGVVLGSAVRNEARIPDGRAYTVRNLSISDLDAAEVDSVKVVVWEEVSGVGYIPLG